MRLTARRRVLRVRVGGSAGWQDDRLVAEEPLELRLGGLTLAVTMRTPGDDVDLALGYCIAEGLIGAPDDVASIRACAADTVEVTLATGVAPPAAVLDAARRLTTTTSACGLCGAASIEAVRRAAPWQVATDRTLVDPAVLAGLPAKLRAAQRIFDRTGGVHAAGLFSPDGALIAAREDIGRHNAVDKLVGYAARQSGLPLAGRLLVVSSRASFELVQKALMAGIPMLAAVSAASALAAALADEAGLTLIGFLRAETMNVYTHPWRVAGVAGGAGEGRGLGGAQPPESA